METDKSVRVANEHISIVVRSYHFENSSMNKIRFSFLVDMYGELWWFEVKSRNRPIWDIGIQITCERVTFV